MNNHDQIESCSSGSNVDTGLCIPTTDHEDQRLKIY